MLRLAIPFIGIAFPGSRYVTFKNAPLFPKRDLHFYQSYNLRKSFRAWYWRGFCIRLGWYYIADWPAPERAVTVYFLRDVIRHLLYVYNDIPNQTSNYDELIEKHGLTDIFIKSKKP